jgi:hypothetical protein
MSKKNTKYNNQWLEFNIKSIPSVKVWLPHQFLKPTSCKPWSGLRRRLLGIVENVIGGGRAT